MGRKRLFHDDVDGVMTIKVITDQRLTLIATRTTERSLRLGSDLSEPTIIQDFDGRSKKAIKGQLSRPELIMMMMMVVMKRN